MIACSNCSSENESDAKFCKNCGNSLIIHSNVVEITKKGDSKVLNLQNRESRMKKAREIALKTMNETNSQQKEQTPSPEIVKEPVAAIHIGEKII